MSETDVSFSPPSFLQDIDDDVIHARMLDHLPADIDRTEGGFAHDFTRPVAIEKAELMIMMSEVIQMSHAAWSYGVWLDQIAADAGLSRRAANVASGMVRVAGAVGVTIPKGFLFATPSALGEPAAMYEVDSAVTIGVSGVADVPVRCGQGGAFGNVPADSITLMAEPLPGVYSVSNTAPLTGGSDAEDDDSLRARVLERNAGLESYAGSAADYRRWAKEVDGVGDCLVIPEWQGAGTGTVKLIVVDQKGEPANQTILDAVYAHICAPGNDDARKAPIGAIVSVAAPEVVPVGVEVTLRLGQEATIASVKPLIEQALKAEMGAFALAGEVVLTRVGRIVGSVEGVLDYSALKINGVGANLSLAAGAYPKLGEVNLNAG